MLFAYLTILGRKSRRAPPERGRLKPNAFWRRGRKSGTGKKRTPREKHSVAVGFPTQACPLARDAAGTALRLRHSKYGRGGLLQAGSLSQAGGGVPPKTAPYRWKAPGAQHGRLPQPAAFQKSPAGREIRMRRPWNGEAHGLRQGAESFRGAKARPALHRQTQDRPVGKDAVCRMRQVAAVRPAYGTRWTASQACGAGTDGGDTHLKTGARNGDKGGSRSVYS